MLPGNRRNTSHKKCLSVFHCGLFDFMQARQQSRVIVINAVCDQSTTFTPDGLFAFSLEPRCVKICIRNCSAQLMIAFPAIHGLLDILPQGQGIDIVKKVDRMEKIIQFQKSLLCAILTCVLRDLCFRFYSYIGNIKCHYLNIDSNTRVKLAGL